MASHSQATGQLQVPEIKFQQGVLHSAPSALGGQLQSTQDPEDDVGLLRANWYAGAVTGHAEFWHGAMAYRRKSETAGKDSNPLVQSGFLQLAPQTNEPIVADDRTVLIPIDFTVGI